MSGISQTIENDDEIISQFVVSKVQDFEKEDGILEYTDNDNTVEISGEENNFHTAVEIWGQNTANETQILNTIPANTTLEPNNTTTNEVENQTNNETTFENINMDPTSVENPTMEENILQETTQEQTQTTPETTLSQETESQQTIQEEDNFRTQGFLEVNENPVNGSSDDTFIIGENYEETLENITNWIQKIDWKSYLLTGAKANCTQEELVENIQKILQNRMKQNNSFVIKVYVSEGKTIKISCEIPETLESFDVQILSKGDNEKYLNITSLIGEEDNSNGTIFSIYHKKSDTIMKTKVNVNQIKKSKIVQKANLDLQTTGTLNSKKYTTDINASYSDSEGEFKVNAQNSLNFDVVPEIENLTENNCLFLDSLSNEELILTVDAIKQKTLEVLREKNRNLNIIDINSSNLIGQPTEQNSREEDREAKEQAKQALIQNISRKMGDYQNQGKDLKIEDLEALEIPGYEVNISISSNLAIITVNGYQFKLDSEFHLSDS